MRQQIALELRMLLGEPRVRWIALAVTLLVGIAFTQGWADAGRRAAEVRHITAIERARWLDQSPKNPHSADHFGTWLFKPISPLAALDTGIDPYVGRMIRLEAHLSQDPVFRVAQDMAPLGRSGATSVADVVRTIAPLLVMLLGVSAFASDRERGTLRLALGNGTSPRAIVTARVTAMLAVTAAMVAGPLLVAGAIALATLDGAGWDVWPRLLLWVATQTLYAGLFLLIALAISLRSATHRAAIASVLLVWCLLCVLMPRLLVAGVERVMPAPSYSAMRAEVDRRTRAFNTAEANQAHERAFLARYGVSSADDLPVDLRGAMLDARDRNDYRVFDQEFDRFYDAIDRQQRAFDWASLLSPAAAAMALSDWSAGSNQARHRDFVRAAEQHRRLLSDTMNAVLMANPQKGGATMTGGRAIWERVPAFAYVPARVARSASEAWVPAGVLLLWTATAGLVIVVLTGRMRP